MPGSLAPTTSISSVHADCKVTAVKRCVMVSMKTAWNKVNETLSRSSEATNAKGNHLYTTRDYEDGYKYPKTTANL